MNPNDDGRSVTCDLLIVGSGAAAMTAALTASSAGLKVLMVEKEDQFGGASARSGGCLWVPNTTHARKAGVPDSRDDAIRFLENESGNRFNRRNVEAFVDTGPKMVDFVEANSPVRFGFLTGYPDYHCDTPGGSTRGRGLYPHNWDAKPLGKELARLRPALRTGTFLGMQVGVNEVGYYMTAGRKIGSALYVAGCIAKRVRDQFRAGRTMRLALGNALVGGLASAILTNGGEIWTHTPARRLTTDRGRVTGAEVDTPNGRVTITARRGVILGTGGFPHDAKRRSDLFPAGATAPEVWGMLPYGNSGDGIRMGEAVGGRFDADVKSPIALTPITRLHSGEGVLETMPCFFNRGMPGIIMVTRDGKRFANEGRSYHDVSAALLAKEGHDGEAVAWMIFDHRYLRRYGNGPVYPVPMPYRHFLRNGYLKTGRTVRALAEAVGIDADGLEASVARYNEFARKGCDPDFGRGTNAFDIANGDPEHKPNPCVGPLDQGPFYAIRTFAGCVGTFAGLQADEHARVLDNDGAAIPGLYVVGNDMLSVTGGDYVAGGCTLGPGMTFGYIAARHAMSLMPTAESVA
ncbi:MAG TPA: FAD-dependent oxidoreductase [Sphingomonadaceae bacterium]|nr:FAD-dependent oxidoreductase [Sphingomonadaceae bacterium]